MPRMPRESTWCLLAGGLLTSSLPAVQEGGEIVVAMDEVSVFDSSAGVDLVDGAGSVCAEEPDADVEAYPSFASDEPIYGTVQLETWKSSGEPYRFAIDESGGTSAGYDLLYLDRNRDLDLTNDPPLRAQEQPPQRALDDYDSIEQQVCFATFAVPWDFGSAGSRDVEIMPRLTISDYGDGDEYTSVSFIATRARRGELEIGDRKLTLFLAHDRCAVGGFDETSTSLILVDRKRRSGRVYWWGGDRLNALHEIAGELYGFSASATGDHLTVRPYRGALGSLEVGAGGRDIETMTVSGSLRSREVSVAVGPVENGWSEPVQSCRLPVGSYMPTYLTIEYGALSISISNNYHSDGNPRERGDLPSVYGIEIREDRPFELDFSTRPDVLFASPAQDLRIERGATLEVSGVLIDPKLDAMIRGLDKVEKGGRGRGQSLDPKVLITRLDGERVAEGVMPFG